MIYTIILESLELVEQHCTFCAKGSVWVRAKWVAVQAVELYLLNSENLQLVRWYRII